MGVPMAPARECFLISGQLDQTVVSVGLYTFQQGSTVLKRVRSNAKDSGSPPQSALIDKFSTPSCITRDDKEGVACITVTLNCSIRASSIAGLSDSCCVAITTLPPCMSGIQSSRAAISNASVVTESRQSFSLKSIFSLMDSRILISA